MSGASARPPRSRTSHPALRPADQARRLPRPQRLGRRRESRQRGHDSRRRTALSGRPPRHRAGDPARPRHPPRLLILHLLALLTVRVWDEGDADANLDLLSRLLASCKAPRQRTALRRRCRDAPADWAVALRAPRTRLPRAPEKVRTLSEAHQLSDRARSCRPHGLPPALRIRGYLRSRHRQHARRQRRRLSVALFRAGAPDSRIHATTGRARTGLPRGRRRGAPQRPGR